ncbi:MAG: lipoate--protein ligase [Clostridioides sp.]|jgi:lipoate-protein ligase A|nr:lipoate--protein ligase [Clostridioides sp.]
MLFVENFNTNPYCNHALEEWLMDNYDEDCFMLWRNKKSILLGKNQNAPNEINIQYAKEHGIHIVRRITGGGTVFTDEENLMFSFISSNSSSDFTDFKKFTKPILNALSSLGVCAEFTGRNDILIEGRKISGNAQCRYKNKVLHHGTLMFEADTGEMAKALKVHKLKLEGKGVKSVESRVTNIKKYLKFDMNIEEFRTYLFDYVKSSVDNARLLKLTDDQWEEVRCLALKKHSTDKWIYGTSPSYNTHNEVKFSWGILEVFIDIKKDRINSIRIYGDFFGDGNVSDIEEKLKGTLYNRIDIANTLSTIDSDEYFYKITREELIDAIKPD